MIAAYLRTGELVCQKHLPQRRLLADEKVSASMRRETPFFCRPCDL